MPNKEAVEIGKRLKEWVVAEFPSVAEFARKTERPSQYWYQYFSGRRRPGTDAQALIRSAGGNIEWLMTGEKHGSNDRSAKRPAIEPLVQFYATDDVPLEERKRIMALAKKLSKLKVDELDKIDKLIDLYLGPKKKARRP